MYTKAYEIRKGDGYAIFELTIKDGRVTSEAKLCEWDFLTIALAKLMSHIQMIAPDLKPSTRKNEALSDKDEKHSKVTQ